MPKDSAIQLPYAENVATVVLMVDLVKDAYMPCCSASSTFFLGRWSSSLLFTTVHSWICAFLPLGAPKNGNALLCRNLWMVCHNGCNGISLNPLPRGIISISSSFKLASKAADWLVWIWVTSSASGVSNDLLLHSCQ